MEPETGETRAKLANAIRTLQAKGDTNTINQLVSAYKAKYVPQSQSSLGISDVLGVNKGGLDPKQVVELRGKYKDSVSGGFKSGVEQTKTGYSEAKTAAESGNLLKLFEGSIKMGAGVVGSIFSPLAPVSDAIGAVTKPVSDIVSDIPAVQKFAQTKTGQNVARVAEDTANLSALVGGVAGAMDLAPKITTFVKDTATKIKNPLPKAPPVLDEVKINDLYNRAIKPTVVGKSNAGQITKANENVISGVKTITDNKANLTFTDANGETITGATPKSVDQFTQAIEQTKKSIFKQYDALAKQAGEEGIKVDTASIGAELGPVIDSKSLAIANPKAIEYATKLQERLTQTGSIDAETAQQVIQHYNDSLKAFYKNPSYETASNVQIDALIANKFREALDKGITGATGTEYGALKKQYGSLSAIEKDVAHRNIVWGRQNGIGLVGNLANITSGVELIRGLVTMNPADLAVSLGIKGFQKWIQYLNNPDVGVSRIFSAVEKTSPSATGSSTGSTTPKPVIRSSPKSTTESLKGKSIVEASKKLGVSR